MVIKYVFYLLKYKSVLNRGFLAFFKVCFNILKLKIVF